MFGLLCTLVCIGLITCLNLFLLVFSFLCPGTDLGLLDCSKKKWWHLDVPCLKCPKRVTFTSGIICANYGHNRGTPRRCNGAWCAGCFTPHPFDHFETAVPRDFNGASLAELEDEVRFRRARPGDHMCTPFQCSSCQSYNIRNRPLVSGDVDSEVFDCLVIRATLDAFWSRSTRTIAGHLREVKLIIKYASELGATNPLPRLGSFPLYHHLGMLQAIMVCV